MKNITVMLVVLALIGKTAATSAPFQNLDFESVVPPLIPDAFSRVPITNGLPSWHGYVGGIEQTNVFFSAVTFGAASLTLISRDAGSGSEVLQGNYSVFLHSSPLNAVTISQTGHIPGDAQSLHFLGELSAGPPLSPPESYFGVFVDGHALSVNDSFVSPGIYNFAADISGFAGSDATLSFNSFNNILFYEGSYWIRSPSRRNRFLNPQHSRSSR